MPEVRRRIDFGAYRQFWCSVRAPIALEAYAGQRPEIEYPLEDMAQWVKCEHSRAQIDRAASALVPWWMNPDLNAPIPEHTGERWKVVQNWRTSHAFPLNTFQTVLRQRARRIEPGAIVAQRLKRISSVMSKLIREPGMKLSRMHDLGGCRAILSDVAAVDRLFEVYCGYSDPLFETEGRFRFYDYIRHPKDDGYRGVHVVGRYYSSHPNAVAWNGQRIEIQLRSRLQHAFATTVETVTTFTRQPLKFGGGPSDWRRFFSLMGSILALREGTALVENTPRSESELVRELREAARALRVQKRLSGWTHAVQTLQGNTQKFKWLLLVLNVTANTISVTGYSDRQQASKAVAEIEQTKRPDLDAVLVWVPSITELKTAYPNYYADTGEFIDALNLALKT
jgi:hypothetical protein